MSVEIIFETHSLTIDNELGLATGWLPGKLPEKGKRLADELGKRRRNKRIDAVFTVRPSACFSISDLNRSVNFYRDILELGPAFRQGNLAGFNFDHVQRYCMAMAHHRASRRESPGARAARSTLL